jgi:hypothetical protein
MRSQREVNFNVFQRNFLKVRKEWPVSSCSLEVLPGATLQPIARLRGNACIACGSTSPHPTPTTELLSALCHTRRLKG